ncbi:DUF6571 family protein [Streptomyces sp. NPDC001250]|uniref:DUF6571 family protein n=1 Tax=unclassified Streptomyces TaxID=2593676 RepID=UPI0033328005
MGEFSAIDPAAMQSMITSYNKDKGDLRNSVTNLKSRFDQYGIDSGDLTQILSICNWLDDQLTTLTRHQVLGAALEREHPGLTMVQVPEPVVSAAQARKDGKDLADRMNKIDGTGDSAKQYHEIAQQLAAHKDDPDYCSAFYAAINPNLAQNIPTFLTSTGSSTAGEDLKAYSQAFGSACSDDYPAPGFDKVKKLYLTPPPKGDNILAWNRGAMLQYGQFPADFLAKAARANVLDSFAKDHDQNFSVLNQGQGLGLSSNTMALYLKALGTNGDATRDALGHMGGNGCGTDLQGNLKSLIAYTNQSHDPDMTDALKSALTAGSGDQVTHSADGSLHVVPTMHGGFEADFAATSMSALAQSHVDYKTYKDYIDTTFTAYGTPPGANSDQKGAQDAFLLHLATTGDAKWPPIRPAITSVGKDADALKGDTDFMSGFYSQGGDRFEAQVAAALHAEDGTHNGQVLSKDSQQILAEFGANLAAASKLEASGKIPTGLTQTFTNPADMWSATMLMKYGPKGDEWDHSFLTAMGDAVLHWRATRDVRPSYTPGMVTVAGYAPGGFVDPKNAWYSELGLKEDYVTMNMDSQMAVARGIVDNDPSLAVLSKLADNATASRDLLSGKDGLFAARQLVNDHWQSPGLDDDESEFPAKVINLATQKTPDLSANKHAATAAQNVFQAAIEDYHTSQDASSYEKEQYPHMPPKLAQALADVAGLYTPDLAQSVNNTAPKNPKWNDPRFDVSIDAKTHQPIVVTDANALDHLIHEILRDPKAGGAYSGYTRAYITTVARTSQSDPNGARKLIRELGNLDGHIELAKSDAPYSAAERQDAADVEKQKYTWVVGGVLSAVPVPLGEGASTALETTVGLVQTAIAGETANKSYDFGGGHAAAVASAEQAKSNAEMLSLQFPIIQGLINAHKLPRPEDCSWFHNGQLDADEILRSPTSFNAWKAQYGITDDRTYQDLFNAAKDGYGESTPTREANSDPYKDGN